MAERGVQIEHLPVLLPALSEHPLSQGLPVSGLLALGGIFVFGVFPLAHSRPVVSYRLCILDCLGVPA